VHVTESLRVKEQPREEEQATVWPCGFLKGKFNTHLVLPKLSIPLAIPLGTLVNAGHCADTYEVKGKQ
jgi:hypothetical protein